MVIALTPREKREYTPLLDRVLPANLRTTFLFRDLTEGERAMIADNSFETIQRGAASEGIVRALRGTQTRMALRIALVGTKPGEPLREGQEDGAIVDVPFAADGTGQVTDGYLRRIPWDVQQLLAQEIIERAHLEAAELEKSVLSRVSSGTQGSQTAPETAGAPEPDQAATTEEPGELLDLGAVED